MQIMSMRWLDLPINIQTHHLVPSSTISISNRPKLRTHKIRSLNIANRIKTSLQMKSHFISVVRVYFKKSELVAWIGQGRVKSQKEIQEETVLRLNQ